MANHKITLQEESRYYDSKSINHHSVRIYSVYDGLSDPILRVATDHETDTHSWRAVTLACDGSVQTRYYFSGDENGDYMPEFVMTWKQAESLLANRIAIENDKSPVAL